MLEINLTKTDRTEIQGHTSKGNQPKWYCDGYWYKADHMGYEALAEVLTSRLLRCSGITDFVSYEPAMIHEGEKSHSGCRSINFQSKDEMLVPLERLYRAYHGQSLAKKLASIQNVKEQIAFTVQFTESVTGISDFGRYLSTLIELDAFILNEDRHTNNIAVLRNETTGKFRLCPIFDNGLSFLSDINDYPINTDIYSGIKKVEAKPFSRDFMEQLDAVSALYGSYLHFILPGNNIAPLFGGLSDYYSEEIITRVETVLREQIRKFQYLF